MGLFDDLFGNTFDFDCDGKTDFSESLMALEIMGVLDDILKKKNDPKKPGDDKNKNKKK